MGYVTGAGSAVRQEAIQIPGKKSTNTYICRHWNDSKNHESRSGGSASHESYNAIDSTAGSNNINWPIKNELIDKEGS